MRLIIPCLFFSLFFFSPSAFSQDFIDIFSGGYNTSPYNRYKDFDNKVTVSETFANLRFPIQREDKSVLIFGFGIYSLSFENEPQIDDNIKLYSPNLELGYSRNLGEKLTAMVTLLPRLSSDFKDIQAEDYQIGGLLLFTYAKEENLRFKFGAYYNKEFFGPFFVPLLGIDWQPYKEIKIFGNLPVNMTCAFSPNERLSFGLFFKSSVGSYRLGDLYSKDYVQKSTNDLSFFWDTHLSKNIVFTLKAGRSIGRSYRTYSENDKLKMKISFFNIGDKREKLSKEFDDGFIYELKLSYRVSI